MVDTATLAFYLGEASDHVSAVSCLLFAAFAAIGLLAIAWLMSRT